MGKRKTDRKAKAEAQPPGGVAEAPVEAGRPWPAWAFYGVLALSGVYLTVQLTVPLAAIFIHPSEVRTDFSWDMFAVRRDCRECVLMTSQPGQAARKVGWGKLYKTPFQAARTRNKTRLPQAAREVCRREQAAGRKEVQVFIECNCRYNQGELIDLDPFGGDYCSQTAAERFD